MEDIKILLHTFPEQFLPWILMMPDIIPVTAEEWKKRLPLQQPYFEDIDRDIVDLLDQDFAEIIQIDGYRMVS